MFTLPYSSYAIWVMPHKSRSPPIPVNAGSSTLSSAVDATTTSPPIFCSAPSSIHLSELLRMTTSPVISASAFIVTRFSSASEAVPTDPTTSPPSVSTCSSPVRSVALKLFFSMRFPVICLIFVSASTDSISSPSSVPIVRLPFTTDVPASAKAAMSAAVFSSTSPSEEISSLTARYVYSFTSPL